MPPERHSPGPARPSRDRFGGAGGFGPKRSFSGPPSHGGGGPRDNRPPFGDSRPPFGDSRPPFTPRPAPPPPEPVHSVRLHEGDREVEVSGTPSFVRQILDDLPAMFARLRGETPPPTKPASISLPPPPQQHEPAPPAAATPAAPAPGAVSNGHGNGTGGELEDEVFDVLTHAEHPLSVAAIRERLAEPATGQQIRRILERAADRVVANDERPAAYSLR
ncbi:MAG TPA: hypothetical protein VGQ42_16180 [Candidatus Dormibacteraeota bacterium]|jgi:hypothetical protein|nr:hypothetical protein [Candidatus Dormibacteraeota bacterium]